VAEAIVPDYAALQIPELDFDEPAQVNIGWTGKRKVIGGPGGGAWTGRVFVEDIATEVEERPWRGFVASLEGVKNWFKLYLPCQSHIGPAPTVDTGAGNGRTLPLSGMTPNTVILVAGQHLTVPLPSGRVRAVRLKADLATDVAGKAVAQFGPALNEVPTLGTAVESAKPYVRVNSTDERNAIALSNGVSGFAFDVTENFDV
jgi:hypothetical protein